MRRCAAQLRCLFAIRIRSATDCAESRNTPADPSRGQGISPNYVWLSKYTAVLSSRNPLTLWTSGQPPRGRGSIPHAGGSRHQHRCGAEIPAASAGIAVRNVAMHLMPLVNGAQRQEILFRGYLCGIQTHHRRLGMLLAHRRQSPVVGRWVEPVESMIGFYRRNEREES